ncbi:TetR/AcrR family transcriptional regulator [Natronobacterium texcoconense]|uniref:DNA-binding transcriptional regulator, AcrR family n=1 Tax=Natronobacterium texcoconense TaxID=1095778 RepID=A0A1H1ILN5_NATTX|nr:TetR/AcrR family transcriptional regulator [Natronobacterium texcoconense]SDR38641.1 DNA-binding transcriptional regulator, AcrR family [Natronobacterium texcoconense]
MTDPDVRDAIMKATYEAVCEYGYTDLTAQDIADRTDKSKSLLFYHYDSKEDLVADFVDYLVEWFGDRFEETEELPPTQRLATFVDWFLYGSTDADERQSIHTAMLEIRTQAPHNEQYREQLRRSDDLLREILEEILRDGIEAGEFEDHDPEETAALLIATLDGARIRQLTLERDDYVEQVRSAIVSRIFADILADGVSFPADSPAVDELDRSANTSISDAIDDPSDEASRQ